MSKKLTAADLKTASSMDYRDVAAILESEGFTGHKVGHGVNWRNGDEQVHFNADSGTVGAARLHQAGHAIERARAAKEKADAAKEQLPEWMPVVLARYNLEAQAAGNGLIISDTAYPEIFSISVPNTDTVTADGKTRFQDNFAQQLVGLSDRAKTYRETRLADYERVLEGLKKDFTVTEYPEAGAVRVHNGEFGVDITIPAPEKTGRIEDHTFNLLGRAEEELLQAMETPAQGTSSKISPEAVLASRTGAALGA